MLSLFASTPTPYQAAADILAFLTAFLGILSTIYTLLVQIIQRRNKPKKRSPLKFLSVQYQPVEEQDWRRRKQTYLTAAVSCFIILAAYSFVLSRIYDPGDTGRVWAYLIIAPIIFFNILLFFYFYVKMGKQAKDARTFFFGYAIVEVEANLETTFVECLSAAKNITTSSLEFDVAQGYIEANVTANLQSLGGILCIQITPENAHCCEVRIKVERRFALLAFTGNSQMMLSFLEQLLGA